MMTTDGDMNSSDYTNRPIVRPAVGSDLPQLHAFLQPFIEAKWLLPRTQDELSQLLGGGFVADVAGTIVGFAALEIYSSKLAELRSLAVAPDWQRHGVGRMLVNACIDHATARNILEVMAITSSEAFFRSCGFDFTLPGEKKALFLQTRPL
ncbi:MAG: GNAT family N-acetyltransferase [Planctomycetota bacterium]|nr:GNAT family N-acetyltransferase [Planctomycetota bacterium]MDA1212899.1 GNAT family N-acetyltransferase [Planctomycetota bacterium]